MVKPTNIGGKEDVLSKTEDELIRIIQGKDSPDGTFGNLLFDYIFERKGVNKAEYIYQINMYDFGKVHKFFEQYYKEAKIHCPARNTLENWANDIYPQSRKQMFQLAFAMKFNVEQTTHLMEKIYLDIAFNFRDPHEIIYYYCLCRGYDYKKACDLIAEADESTSAEQSQTQYTYWIKEKIDEIIETVKNDDDEELLNFIQNNTYNYKKKNVTMANLLLGISSDGNEENVALYDDDKGIISLYNKVLAIAKESSPGINKDDVILHYAFDANNAIDESTLTIHPRIKDHWANGKRRIRSKAGTNSLNDVDSIAARKMLVLYYSLYYWDNIKKAKKMVENDTYATYCAELNNALAECSFAELSCSNPFDLLVLYCTAQNKEDPLTVFHKLCCTSGITTNACTNST